MHTSTSEAANSDAIIAERKLSSSTELASRPFPARVADARKNARPGEDYYSNEHRLSDGKRTIP
jgi:hypothetical protein